MHLMILAVLALLILILSLLLKKQTRRLKSTRENSPEPRRQLSLRSCLLCGEPLAKGEAVRTSLYPEDGREGRLLEIHGCARCGGPGAAPGKQGTVPGKKCPLCGASLKREEPLFARRFEMPGKNRVTVLGCPRCYRPGS